MVLCSPLWRCTWSIFAIWKPKSILLIAMPRLDRRLYCALESKRFHIHFLSSTSLSAKQHQSGSGQSSCTHVLISNFWNEFRLLWFSLVCSTLYATTKRCDVFFFQSSNQPHHFSLIYKFPVYQFTCRYISSGISSAMAAAVRCWIGCVDTSTKEEYIQVRTWSMFMFWSAHFHHWCMVEHRLYGCGRRCCVWQQSNWFRSFIRLYRHR